MLTWYLIRSFGMVAVVALSASTALGALASVGGTTPQGLERRTLRQLVHRSVALIGLAALALHLVLTALDSFVPAGWSGVFVPFGSSYSRFSVGLGSIGMWVLVLAAVVGLLRHRLTTAMSPAAWRRIHATAYAGWALAMAHGLITGTDSGTTWARLTYLVCAIAVGVAVVVRLMPGPRRVRDPNGHRVLTTTGGPR